MTNEEAIGRIQEHIRIHSKKEPFTPYLDEAFDMAIEALKGGDAKAKYDRPHGEWIPCNERLPDKDGKYLITWHSPRGKDHICEKAFTNGSWNSSFNITAWMPFPEPYKEVMEKT